MAKSKMKQSSMYEADYKTGKLTRKSSFCPRCKGVFLANHNDRKSCGNCGYTEYKKSKK